MPASFPSAVLGGVCHGQNFTCPEIIEGICDIGQYPDPESCAHYYNCVQHLISGCDQTRYQCQQFYAFDKETRLCVPAVDAECDSKF